ncbi:hypothetical protein BKA65DRAFT_224031 [Rhexocercosporidium sp. MPI-PUGE-AT-0058]|nr:hypothetical protein BKA65DRAFT_224031 [Rhexocercosporidium sp. MPI-PUGE-AT-0058]
MVCEPSSKYLHPQGRKARAKFPKVRTGCLTCKARHKKCDEAKPTCQRCWDGGYKCDGYLQVEEPPPWNQRNPLSKSKSQALDASKRAMNFLYLSDLGAMPGSQRENSIFFHLTSCTVKDLIGYSPSLTHFWCGYVLPFGHMASHVRHALISLGASHRSFLLKDSSDISLSEKQSYDRFAIQQYNKAISDLTPIMANPSSLDLQAILTCCLIFVCIDNLNGRYASAVGHLRAGSDLLYSLQDSEAASAAEGAGSAQAKKPTNIKCDNNALCGLSDMFARLGLDASLFVDSRLVRHRSFSTYGLVTDDGNHEPFQSSSAARGELLKFDLDIQYFWYPADGSHCPMGPQDEVLGPGEAASDTMTEEQRQEFQNFCNRFDRWTSRFNLYLENTNHTSVSEEEFNEAMVLSLHQRVWSAILKQGPCSDVPLDRQDFEGILNQAELVIADSTKAHPIFSFDADTIPPVSFVAAFCDDSDLKMRAITMLRTINRSEGVWDSKKMADMYDAALIDGGCNEKTPSDGCTDFWDTTGLGQDLSLPATPLCTF